MSLTQPQFKLALPGVPALEETINKLSESGVEERGAIYTRREVVDFILDLVGYRASEPLHRKRILEPSFGDGDFLLAALERLFTSFQIHGKGANPVLALKNAIRGIELHGQTYNITIARVIDFLADKGLTKEEARTLAQGWLHHGDFLLTDFDDSFTHVIGNPPYVRQELIPDDLMSEYRRRYQTIFDRADLYVPFIEHALRLLASGGHLGFICADRWMKNRYGGPLRELVAGHYRLRTYVDMVDTQAFHSEVSAYPAIFVIGNEAPGPTRIAHRPAIDPAVLKNLAGALTAEGTKVQNEGVIEVARVATGREPWLLESLDQLAVVRRLEAELPTLEEAECKVGIGVATGADKVFIAPFDDLDVEDDRKLPLVMSRDIASGEVMWRGYGVLNPFLADGRLAPLEAYPRFARYLDSHGEAIKKRHVSQNNPGSWYRTIDRIYPELTKRPKLLIPDIKGGAHIVYEKGELYPHHNLYFITSDEWDLKALQAVLLSGIARLFVATYSTKMRGGYLRFQAQYIRRIRLPRWGAVPSDLRISLMNAADHKNRNEIDSAVAKLYGLSAAEREAVLGETEKSNGA